MLLGLRISWSLVGLFFVYFVHGVRIHIDVLLVLKGICVICYISPAADFIVLDRLTSAS